MDALLVLCYSDLFDRRATKEELIALLRTVSLRHAAFVISCINLQLRDAMQKGQQVERDAVLKRLIAGYIDDEILALIKQRFPKANVHERPVFAPQGLLSLFRLAVCHCDPAILPDDKNDEQVRYAIGRSAVMMNDLLFPPEEVTAIQALSIENARVEMMVQAMAAFELTNAPKREHLVPRLHIMYRVLLRDPQLCERIAHRCEGFEFAREFDRLVGMPLEDWLFVVLAIYSFFTVGTNGEPQYILNPRIFRGDSAISDHGFEVVLNTISTSIDDLKAAILSERPSDPRYDFVSFRSRPLLVVEDHKVLTADPSFVLEKCHTGVQWTMHDLLPVKKRQTLFNAWGELFQAYVHWLLEGMKTDLPLKYSRFPQWKDTSEESFDGLLIQRDILVPAEYKGGFLPRDARYSGDSQVFLKEMNKKFAPGCDQLAEKIGALFADDSAARREIDGLDSERVRTVIPLLVLQDHIFRVPLLNWYLNKKFWERLSSFPLRAGVAVRPLIVVGIHDLESMVYSAEGSNFDLVRALYDRTVKDEEALCDVLDVLSSHEDFDSKPSPRLRRMLDEVLRDLTAYLFPGAKDEGSA